MKATARLTAVTTTIGLALALAAPAAADGLNIFANNPQFVWQKGCVIKYSLSADMPAPYATAIQEGLAAIAGPMAMTVIPVAASDPSPAHIRYSINPNLPSGAAGMGSTAGTVELAPLNKLPNWGDETVNANVRKNLVVHETLHVFGLAHDLDETDPNGPDEIMYPILPMTPLHFGNGDLTGMAFIRDRNRCGTANPVVAAPVAPTSVDAYLSSAKVKRTPRGVTFTWKPRNETGVAGEIVIRVSVRKNDKEVGACTSTGSSCSIRLPKGKTYFASMTAHLRTDDGLVMIGMPNMFPFRT